MASSGCRIGAIPKLRLSALKYIENYQLYQVTFQEHSKKDAYYSFTTPECANYINEYLECFADYLILKKIKENKNSNNYTNKNNNKNNYIAYYEWI